MSKYTQYQLENKVNIAKKYWQTTSVKGYLTFEISADSICQEFGFKNRSALVKFIREFELSNNFKCNNCQKEYFIITRTQAYELFKNDCTCKLVKPLQTNNTEKEININEDFFIDGAFIKGFRIINNEVSKSYFWIKLTEIKSILPLNNEECYFNTFKDCYYWVQCSDHSLRLLINTYLFNTEEYLNSFAQEFKTK